MPPASRHDRRLLLAVCAAMLVMTLLQGCARLHSLEGRSVSAAATDTDATPLGRAVQPAVQAHRGRSGVFALADARDAFAARALLARAATRTLDVQYYIWRNDLSGTLLLRELLDTPQRELLLVSPYFVPTAVGVTAFAELAEEGVRIRVLTNALEATDVAAVHAGYAQYRRPLLQAGIALYEMKREGLTPSPSQRGPGGSSATSLHAKTFAVDGARVFIGSFNFDPRSARLNTEMGFVIHSTALARRMGQAFEERVPRRAYQVTLGQGGALRWVEHTAADEHVHEQEPGAGFWLLLGVRMLSWLPIEGLL